MFKVMISPKSTELKLIGRIIEHSFPLFLGSNFDEIVNLLIMNERRKLVDIVRGLSREGVTVCLDRQHFEVTVDNYMIKIIEGRITIQIANNNNNLLSSFLGNCLSNLGPEYKMTFFEEEHSLAFILSVNCLIWLGDKEYGF